MHTSHSRSRGWSSALTWRRRRQEMKSVTCLIIVRWMRRTVDTWTKHDSLSSVMLDEIKECSRESGVEHVNSSKIRFFDLNIELFRCTLFGKLNKNDRQSPSRRSYFWSQCLWGSACCIFVIAGRSWFSQNGRQCVPPQTNLFYWLDNWHLLHLSQKCGMHFFSVCLGSAYFCSEHCASKNRLTFIALFFKVLDISNTSI